jgi:hypothetical protein
MFMISSFVSCKYDVCQENFQHWFPTKTKKAEFLIKEILPFAQNSPGRTRTLADNSPDDGDILFRQASAAIIPRQFPE